MGFRERVDDAIGALRLAGTTASIVERARLSDPDERTFLAGVLRRYERLLQERASVETTGVLAIAIAAMDRDGADVRGFLGAEVVLLQAGLGIRGLSGKLIGALARRDARVLETDPVAGEPPDSVLWSLGKAVSAHSFLDAGGSVPETRLDAHVVSGEYHFPTLRGEHEVHRFERVTLEGVTEAGGRMLDGVASGHFVPTDDENDCRICDFAEICRVRQDRSGGVHSPLAAWVKERVRIGATEEVACLAAVRSY